MFFIVFFNYTISTSGLDYHVATSCTSAKIQMNAISADLDQLDLDQLDLCPGQGNEYAVPEARVCMEV